MYLESIFTHHICPEFLKIHKNRTRNKNFIESQNWRTRQRCGRECEVAAADSAPAAVLYSDGNGGDGVGVVAEQLCVAVLVAGGRKVVLVGKRA